MQFAMKEVTQSTIAWLKTPCYYQTISKPLHAVTFTCNVLYRLLLWRSIIWQTLRPYNHKGRRRRRHSRRHKGSKKLSESRDKGGQYHWRQGDGRAMEDRLYGLWVMSSIWVWKMEKPLFGWPQGINSTTVGASNAKLLQKCFLICALKTRTVEHSGNFWQVYCT